jgi:hypothetical protein
MLFVLEKIVKHKVHFAVYFGSGNALPVVD